jgi:hypothetical protein
VLRSQKEEILMIVLSKPYVSKVLEETLRNTQVPVLKMDNLDLHNEQELNIISEQCFFDQYRNGNSLVPLFCNSEGSLPLICKNLPASASLNQIIGLFKDKAEFRRFVRDDFPQFFFQTLELRDWDTIDPTRLPYPVIVKPAAGYSSIGVFRVENAKQWKEVGCSLQQILAIGADMYSADVVNTNKLIIEQWIEGTEYAIDAYFDSDGTPVILNLFTHKFMHDNDLSDRIYYTSKYVLQEMLNPISEFLSKLSEKIDLRLIPLHIEVRQTKEGFIIPIEINPLRFAGCGTTELGIHAYGINSYEYFFQQRKPDWESIVNGMDHGIYSFFLCRIRTDRQPKD